VARGEPAREYESPTRQNRAPVMRSFHNAKETSEVKPATWTSVTHAATAVAATEADPAAFMASKEEVVILSLSRRREEKSTIFSRSRYEGEVAAGGDHHAVRAYVVQLVTDNHCTYATLDTVRFNVCTTSC
jgi:hypothetical protein